MGMYGLRTDRSESGSHGKAAACVCVCVCVIARINDYPTSLLISIAITP